jgi:hypothetical protein
MIPTAKRAARESGIALYIKYLLVRTSINAIYDAKRSEKFHPPPGSNSSDAILSIDGKDAGS